MKLLCDESGVRAGWQSIQLKRLPDLNRVPRRRFKHIHIVGV